VEQQSRRVLAALEYTGLAEVEWKRDPRDGALKFLEVNARCWGWHSLASRVVGNLPKMLFDYLVYDRLCPVEPRYGSRWVKYITDVPVAIDLCRRGELRWRDYFRCVAGDTVCCEWDCRDFRPFFLQFTLLPYLLWKRGY
jgi:predicted ATP-grasp superfamily ATP-dependent carboligase